MLPTGHLPNEKLPPRIRVAIVDDFRLVTAGLASSLSSEEFGFDIVITANTWAELVTSAEFPADVTVLDLNLNDSISIATKINTLRNAGGEAVIISRHAEPAIVARAMKAGALSYIPKTEPIEELVAAITFAARGEARLSGHFTLAITAMKDSPKPALGSREQNALVLYANGLSMKEVSERMETTEQTVKSYIKRARRKFRDLGINVGDRRSLREHGLREGWIDLV